MLARIADLQENKLQARTAALATWRQVLAVDPTHADALTEIERLATLLERFSELVDVYQELAFSRDTADIAGRADLLSRAARLYGGRLGNRRAAIDTWKLVLNLDVDNLATAKPAAAALEALYAETGDIASLVKILRQQARWAETRRRAQGAAVPHRRARGEVAGRHRGGGGDAAVDPGDRRREPRGDRQPGADLRGRLEPPPARRDVAPAHRSRARRGLAPGAVAPGRQPARARRRRRRRGDRGLRQHPRREPRGHERARHAGAPLRPAGAAPRSARHPGAPPGPGAPRTGAGALRRPRPRCCARSRASTKARSAIRRTRSRTGARSWAPRPATPTRWRRSSGSCSPASRPGCGWRRRRRWSRSTSGPAAGRSWPRSSRSTSRRRAIRARASPSCRGWRRCRRRGSARPRRRSCRTAWRSATRSATRRWVACSIRTSGWPAPAPSAAVRRDEVAALYRDITPDVLDEQLRLRLDRYVAEAARGKGDHELAAEYFRRVLDRVPDDDTALAALDQIYTASGDSDGAVRDPDPPRRAGQGSRRRAPAARADRRAGREAARARRRGDHRLRARAGAGAPRSRRDAGAGSPVHRVGALERSHALPVGDHRARPARARGGGDPLPPGADRARPPPRQGERARAAARRAARQPRARGRGRDARGHARRHRRAGRGRRAAGAGLRRSRRLDRADPRRRDPPACRSRTRTQRVAWTKRIARLYEEQLEDYDNALRWYGKVFQEAPTEHQSSEQLLRLAGKLDRWKDVGHLFSDYLASELGDSPEVLDITRRAAEIFDLRLGDREEARKYYRRLHETRPDDREVGAAVRERARALGVVAGAARAGRRAGRARGRARGQEGVPAPQRQARRGAARGQDARDAHAARDRRPRARHQPARGGRDLGGRRARAPAARQRRVARPVGAPGVHAGARARRAPPRRDRAAPGRRAGEARRRSVGRDRSLRGDPGAHARAPRGDRARWSGSSRTPITATAWR